MQIKFKTIKVNNKIKFYYLDSGLYSFHIRVMDYGYDVFRSCMSPFAFAKPLGTFKNLSDAKQLVEKEVCG